MAIVDPEANIIVNEVDKILLALNHRPGNSDDAGYITFIGHQVEKLDQLKIKYPFIDFSRMTKKFNEKTTD